MPLVWRRITDKRTCRDLQSFTCTEPWPTLPNGRRSPAHPRPWEWHAQRLIRGLAQGFKHGDVVLVGNDDSGGAVGVAQVRFEYRDRLLVSTVLVVGVEVRSRRTGDTYRADEVIDRVVDEIVAEAARRSAQRAALRAVIHRDNNASARMALRNGFEPDDDPGAEYGEWIRLVEL